MASQQGRLLHDGIVVATMRMGIPVTQHSLSYRDMQKKPADKVANMQSFPLKPAGGSS